ncbi:phosphatidate cytidylyltransferase [Brachybacterium sp. EF45031]|nr:phosphatidate cytidylyltransferase [Brachybacterium sillae]
MLPEAGARTSHGDHSAPPDGHAKRRGPGRDLRWAIPVGIGLLVLLLVVLFVVPVALPALVALAICLGLLEAARALVQADLRIPVMPLLVGAIGMVVSTAVFGPAGLVISTAVVVCAVILWRLSESRGRSALRDVSAAVFALAWIAFLGCFVILLSQRDAGAWAVLLALLVPVANDTGGYLVGVLLGAHPMAPRISPKKSWEGFAGSLITGVVVASLLVQGTLQAPWWIGAVIGAMLVVVSTVGDLAESLLKRDLGIKDMGHLLPGHGGILDRTDSMLLAAPTTYVLLEVLLP